MTVIMVIINRCHCCAQVTVDGGAGAMHTFIVEPIVR